MDSFDSIPEMKNLSGSERAEVMRILNEMKATGKSPTLDRLKYVDYWERPVTIDEFLDSDAYLARGLNVIDEASGTKKQTVFPFWRDTLRKIFPDNLDTAYNTVVLSGAIGIGKSFMAVLCMLYMLYKMMCLKDPYKHYGLQPIDHITFSFMNITLDAAKGVAWSKFQELLKASPWFMAHGTLSKSEPPEWKPNGNIELLYGSQPSHVIGRAVYASFEDEISFMPNKDVSIQIDKAKQLINSIDARMQSRFMKGEKRPTLHILASSKRTDQSFLETYIDMKRKNESKTTLIVDEPQWVIRTDKDSPRKFWVAIGNKFLDSELVPLNATEKDLDCYRKRGYSLMKVPMGYYEQFNDDIDIALTDIAGISTTNAMSYISGVRWNETVDDRLQNPFLKEILTIGDGPDDNFQYSDFFDAGRVPKGMKEKPMYIHLDMSISGDKTGIAGVWIVGKKPPEEGKPASKELYYQTAFAVSIKAPKGRQVSFDKNCRFIYWLRDSGFNVKTVSSDTFQNAAVGQQLQAHHFDYKVISVDRVENGVCPPYQILKSTIYEDRIKAFPDKQLTDELIGLVRDGNGKIDHSPAGINCLSGDTKVSLLDGREVSMKDLMNEFDSGKTNWVYSINEATGTIEPQPIEKAWCSGRNASLMEVVLDNGEIIRCTPEHRFMLRNGSYIEACNLIPNDSLMPLYRKVSSKGLEGYRLYYEPIEDKWHYEHRRFAKDVLDAKHLVHHRNCNKLDNTPTNLVWCSAKMHQTLHANMQTGAQSKDANAKRKQSLHRYHEDNKNTLSYERRYHKNMTDDEIKSFMANKEESERREMNRIASIDKMFNIDYVSLSTKEKLAYSTKYRDALDGENIGHDDRIASTRRKAAEYYHLNYDKLTESQKHMVSVKYRHAMDPTYSDRISSTLSEKHREGYFINADASLKRNNIKLKNLKKMFPVIDREDFDKTFGMNWEDIPRGQRGVWANRYREHLYQLKNHKVVSVRYLDKKEDVYDITVRNNHNFALSSGIFVHNSKDCADAVCGALFSASQHGEEFAYDFGENIEETVKANGDSSANVVRKQMTVDLESEMNRALDPITQLKSKQEGKGTDSPGASPSGVTAKDGKKDSDMSAYYASNGILLF